MPVGFAQISLSVSFLLWSCLTQYESPLSLTVHFPLYLSISIRDSRAQHMHYYYSLSKRLTLCRQTCPAYLPTRRSLTSPRQIPSHLPPCCEMHVSNMFWCICLSNTPPLTTRMVAGLRRNRFGSVLRMAFRLHGIAA